MTQMNILQNKTDSQTQNRLAALRGRARKALRGRARKGRTGEAGIGRCKLLHTGWMNNKAQGTLFRIL